MNKGARGEPGEIVPRTLAAFGLVCLIVSMSAPALMSQVPQDFDPRLSSLQSSIDAGKYADAEAEAERLVTSLKEASPIELALATDLLVQALTRNGRGAEPRTRVLAEEVIEAKSARFGPRHGMLAPSLRNLGNVLIQAGEYHLAIAPCRQAVEVREQALGAEDSDVADDLDSLARALTLTEQYDEALTAVNRALSIKEKRLDRADVRIARTLEILGVLLQRRGDYAGARRVLERAVAFRETATPTHPETAAVLRLFGDQLWFEGNFVEARQFSVRARALAEQTLRPGHPDLAAYLRSLALPVAGLGDLTAARALRERALAIAEASLGSEHPAVAVQLNDVAMSFGQEGEYSRARALFERALRIQERRLGPDHSDVTTAVYNLAVVNVLLGDFIEARRYFDRAIATWERVLGPDHPFVAYAVSALADMLSEQGLTAEAKALYERALRIREQTLGKNHLDVARTLANLAATVAKQGQLRYASELSARSLGIWEQSGASQTAGVANALMVHGTIRASLGDYDAAEKSYDRAVTVLRQILGPAHPDVGVAQVSLAMTLANKRQWSQAIQDALDADEITRTHLHLTLRYLPERQALGFAATRAKGLDVALSLFNTDGAPTALLFDRVVRGRALILDEMAARHHRSADASGPDSAPLLTALTLARQRLANLVVRGPGQQLPEQYSALVEEARREKEMAERALAEKSAAFRVELVRTEIGLDRVRAALPSGTVLLSFVRYDRIVLAQALSPGKAKPTATANAYPARTVPSYVAFVLRADESAPKAVDLGDAETIDNLVGRWRREIMAGLARSPRAPRAAERSLRMLGLRLRQQIWDPIAKDVEDASRVFVVPDGTMNLIPLAALPIGQTDYLLEKGPILHYVSAERDLVPVVEPGNVGQGLLAVGGPSFNDPSLFAALSKPQSARSRATAQARPQRPDAVASARPVSSPVATSTAFRGLGPSCATFQSLRFEMLPASGREANDVANLWKEFGPSAAGETGLQTVLSGRAANESTFKQMGTGRRVLHLATHGFFLGGACSSALEGTRAVGGLVSSKTAKTASTKPAQRRMTIGENPLLLSGLAMAGANRRAAASTDEEDGILTAEEVASLNLEGTEWAVLSACDTGLGEIKAGEGVFGLRRAFQIAGARTVIMSLWSVEDRSAMEWMRALYEGRLRHNLNTADAVREASLTVLRQRRARGQSVHPFYWAGFVASGDWR